MKEINFFHGNFFNSVVSRELNAGRPDVAFAIHFFQQNKISWVAERQWEYVIALIQIRGN